MNPPQPLLKGHTLEDWATWDGRWELIDGVAYDMTPSPSLEHQRVSMHLSTALSRKLSAAKRGGGKGGCEVFAAPLDLFIAGDVFQPDLVVVCDPAKKTARGIEGPPDLVIEILSPSTASRDLLRKRWAYEAGGVPEYLIVDPQERNGLLLRLEDGKYLEAARVEWAGAITLLRGRIQIKLG